MPFAAKLLQLALRESVDAKRNLKLSRPSLQTSWFPFTRVKDNPPLQANCFWDWTQTGFNNRQQNKNNPETSMARACFPNVFQFPIRETLFPSVSFCIVLTLHGIGNFNENPSMGALAKLLRARASEHSSIFCKQFEQCPNFASTFKLDGTIRYPLQAQAICCAVQWHGIHFEYVENPQAIVTRQQWTCLPVNRTSKNTTVPLQRNKYTCSDHSRSRLVI